MAETAPAEGLEGGEAAPADDPEPKASEVPESTEEQNGEVKLHLSCKFFSRVPGDKIETWCRKMTNVPLQKVLKLTQWSYAFVSLLPENVEAFKEEMASLLYRGHPVVISASTPRSKPGPAEHDDAPPAKRRRQKEPKEGQAERVPTLKDLKDKVKQRKGSSIHEASVVLNTAPLLSYPYETQLTMKGTYVKSAVRSFTKQVKKRCEDEDRPPAPWTTFEWSVGSKSPIGCGCPLDDAIGTPSESISGYRNKCEFTIGLSASVKPGDTSSESTAGGHNQELGEVGFVLATLGNGDQRVASCEEVPHVPEQMKRVCKVMREVVRSSSHPVFDRRRNAKSGVWRTVMCRLSPTGEMLVLVQTATLPDAERDALAKTVVAALESANIGVVSIYWQFNDEVTDAARADAPLLHVSGKPRLNMPLLGLNFEIGPLSFFQSNSVTCAALYQKALEWLRPEGNIVLDVCCGVGTIGLCAAPRCREVIGIELIPEAVESAKHNAKLNKIENARFCVGKAEDVLQSVLADLPSDVEACAVVDPPRPGLHHTVLTGLRKCSQLSRIVYISCNPESLADDVVRLTIPGEENEDVFVPVRAVAVDMFPHTLHCEMVLLLERSSKVPDPRSAADGQAPAATGAAGMEDED